MDETDSPQTPAELLIILVAIADEGIPIQTVAPKFTGRFNKGVDYQGNLPKFAEEFADDLATIAYAVRHYNLPPNLKLSVHSGSDKFSIYAPMRAALDKFNAGVHLKTAGTTWLEELIGLAEGGETVLLSPKKSISVPINNAKPSARLTPPSLTLIPAALPAPDAVAAWTSEDFVSALRHDQSNPAFNSNLRQLLHVGFKVAAKLGPRYIQLLEQFEPTIAKNVTTNLFDRHIKPLFLSARQ